MISHADLMCSLLAAAAAIGVNVLIYWQGWVLAPFRVSREDDPALFRMFFGIQIALAVVATGLALFLGVKATLNGTA